MQPHRGPSVAHQATLRTPWVTSPVIQIDAIDAKALQALLASLLDVLGRAVDGHASVQVVPVGELGGEEDSKT